MDILEVIATRQSIRKFLAQPIPGEIIEKILKAGQRAPSGGNCQPWRFIVVTNPEHIHQFDQEEHQYWVENAPAVIVVCGNLHDNWKKYGEDDTLVYIMDCSAAIENMLLAIHALGLGGVWVRACSKRKIRELLDIPLHWQIISIIPFGYYQAKDEAEFDQRKFSNRHLRSRKPLEEIAFLESANQPYPTQPLK